MNRRLATHAVLAVLFLAPQAGRAQQRPSEEELFGAPTATPTATPAATPTAAPAATPTAAPAATPTAAPAPTSDERADSLLTRDRAGLDGRIDKEKDDPLKVGGMLYLRAAGSWTEGMPPSRWSLQSPDLVEVYLDARPNDRVRGFVLGRLTYDPTIATVAKDPFGVTITQSQTRSVLDQLYVNFDLDRTVFVTAGKQHVKWGTGRFWNPTDYLHPARKDPLSQYDDRSGVTMVKAHLPWEARGWNLYAVALLEDLSGQSVQRGSPLESPQPGDPGALGHVGGAARAEVVLGGVELAGDLVVQQGHLPRFGLDGSFALWELDLHFELALTHGRDAPYWRLTPGLDPNLPTSWAAVSLDRITPQAVVGAEWSWKYSDEDSLTLGAEYSYNDAGYADGKVYPVLLFSPYLPPFDPRTAFTPFYLGRQYLGAYLYLPRPGSWNNTSFTLSVLSNLSDGSGLARFDHSIVLNTYLTLETYLAGHFGTSGGELRFGLDLPSLTVGSHTLVAGLHRPPPVLDFGLALRVKL